MITCQLYLTKAGENAKIEVPLQKINRTEGNKLMKTEQLVETSK